MNLKNNYKILVKNKKQNNNKMKQINKLVKKIKMFKKKINQMPINKIN